MLDLWRRQSTQLSQSQRVSESESWWGGEGGGVRLVMTFLHLASLSLCLLSSSAWAASLACSSIASFLRSRSRLPRTAHFFCWTLDSQVSSSSVWPWGTLELARKESQGWDFLATTRSQGSSVRMVMLLGESWKRESTKLDYERKVKTLLEMLERAAQTNGSGLTFANLIYSKQGKLWVRVHTCVRYRVSSSR